MKTRSKKLVLYALIAVFAVCACFAIMTANIKSSSAADAINEQAFEMEYGAQLALKTDGIRFIVKIGQDNYDKIVTDDTEDNVKLSVYVAPIEYFNALTGEKAGKYNELADYIKININEEKIYTNKGYYYANAVIANLNDSNLSETQIEYDFVGVGAIIDNTTQTPEYTFASFSGGNISNNTRAQYGLLQSAILDSENPEIAETVLMDDTPYTWFGTAEYPVVIDTAEKYNSLVAQSQAVAGIDDLYYEIDSALVGDYNPTNKKTYHHVSFYNADQLLQTVKVYDGESASYTGETPEKVANFYSYEFEGAWVDADGEPVDLTQVTKTQNVYAKFNEISPRTGDDVNTVFFFGEEQGLEQASAARNLAQGDFSIDTTIDADGMLKVTADTSEADKKYIAIDYDVKDYAFAAGDTVALEVYVDLSGDVDFVELYWGYTHRTRLANGEWGMVIVDASHLETSSAGTDYPIRIYAYESVEVYGNVGEDGAAAIIGSIYFGKAKAVASADVVNIYESGTEYTFGSQNIEYVSGESSNALGCTLGDWTPDSKAFNQYGDTKPQIIDGTMRFYMQGSNQERPILALIPKKAMRLGSNAKMHVTIRGNVDYLWFWGYYYSTSAGKYKTGGREGNTTSEVQTLENGYKKYTLNYNSGWAGTVFEEFFIFLNDNKQFTKPNYKLVDIIDITFDDVTWVDKE